MRWICVILLGKLVANSQSWAEEFPTVSIPNVGEVRGQLSTSYGGADYVEFKGIPYAKPPVGNLRFEDPEPAALWNGVWTSNTSTVCIQVGHAMEPEGGISTGSEDCLYLNIYVPGTHVDQSKKFDVIVYIHGGAFMFGSSDYAGPKFLMDRNVVFVTFNYRVGVLGFLSTGDSNLSGNYGLKDQTMALKWVKQNIGYFGGNRDSITITGLSAGGASVHYHYLSPQSRGLFHRGMSLSGCVLNSWTIQEEPLEKARTIGNALGCTQENTKELVACLKQRPAYQLSDAIKILRPWLVNPFSPLGVVVEEDNPKSFLPEHPYKLLKDGNVYDVPWIVSFTTSEGLYPAADIIKLGRRDLGGMTTQWDIFLEFYTKNKHLENINNNWEEYAPAVLHYMETIPDHSKKEVTQKIKQHYIGDKDINRDTFPELVQLIGDRLFVVDIETAARLHSKAVKSPVYSYRFDYVGEERESLIYLFMNLEGNLGVCHGDDTMYVLSQITENMPSKMTNKDEKMKDTLLDMWTSYARTGVPPTSHWTPVSKNIRDPFIFMNIGRDQKLETMTADEVGNKSFWESLNFEENEMLFKRADKIEL